MTDVERIVPPGLAAPDRQRTAAVSPIGTPRWVIIGMGEHDGKAWIMASDKLDDAELRANRPSFDAGSLLLERTLFGRTVYSVAMTIGGRRPYGEEAFWIIGAPSYAECLAHLANKWEVR